MPCRWAASACALPIPCTASRPSAARRCAPQERKCNFMKPRQGWAKPQLRLFVVRMCCACRRLAPRQACASPTPRSSPPPPACARCPHPQSATAFLHLGASLLRCRACHASGAWLASPSSPALSRACACCGVRQRSPAYIYAGDVAHHASGATSTEAAAGCCSCRCARCRRR